MNTGRLLKWAVMDGSRAWRATARPAGRAQATVHCKARWRAGPRWGPNAQPSNHGSITINIIAAGADWAVAKPIFRPNFRRSAAPARRAAGGTAPAARPSAHAPPSGGAP